MDWWVLEVITLVGLVAAIVGLGPLIRRFGRAYAADVFRANPRTGKSYIVLMDIAYYLIFSAYVLFTTVFERQPGWGQTVGPDQLRANAIRVGLFLLIMGVLHGANVLSLPVVGRLLGLGRRFESDGEA